MIAASAGFAAIIDGQAATVDCRVTLTLPAAAAYNDVTALVESMTLNGSLTTDAPEGTRIVTGQAAQSGEVVIGGPSLAGLISILNPYNTASPLYRSTIEGVPVLIEYGLVVAGAPELVPALYGTLDSYSIDMRSGTITLRVIERSRQAARAAVVGLPSFLGKGGYHGDPGLTSGYVADAVLRSVGLHTSPPPRPGATMYASLHGSLYPELYDAANSVMYTDRLTPWPSIDDTASMVQGKWGAEVVPGGRIVSEVAAADAVQPLYSAGGADAGAMFEFNIKVIPAPAAATRLASFILEGFGVSPASDYIQVSVWQLAGTTDLRFAWTARRNGSSFGSAYIGSGTATTGGAGVWVHCLGIIKYPAAAPTTVEMTGYMNNVAIVPAGSSRTIGAVGGTPLARYTTLEAYTAIEGFQTARDLAPNIALSYTFTPTALMDKSTLMLTAVPAIEFGEDAWTVLQEFAAAEQGAWIPDATGRPRFKNRKTIASAAAVRSVVGTTNLLGLTQEISSAGKADRIRQPLTEWAAKPIGYAWEADQIISLEAYETRTFVVQLDYIAVDVYPWQPYADYPLGVFPADATRFRLSTTEDGIGSVFQPAFDSVDIQARSVGPSRIEVKLINRQGFKVYFASPDYMTDVTAGTAYLKIGGRQLQPLTSGGTIIESTGGAGRTVLDLPANRFVQTAQGAQTRTDAVLSDLSRVRPVWRDVKIVADPRLQIGDKVTLTDLEVNGISGETAIVVALDASLSDDDWTQTVDLRALGTPGGWLLAVAGRGEMGQNTYA